MRRSLRFLVLGHAPLFHPYIVKTCPANVVTGLARGCSRWERSRWCSRADLSDLSSLLASLPANANGVPSEDRSSGSWWAGSRWQQLTHVEESASMAWQLCMAPNGCILWHLESALPLVEVACFWWFAFPTVLASARLPLVLPGHVSRSEFYAGSSTISPPFPLLLLLLLRHRQPFQSVSAIEWAQFNSAQLQLNGAEINRSSSIF